MSSDMNLRRQRPRDSLELLLDTMCNTFGGIILLAILVVLLTHHERHASGGFNSESSEMLERRLSIAETNLQASVQLLTALEQKASSPEREVLVSLLSRRSSLQEQLSELEGRTRQAAAAVDANNSQDPAQLFHALNQQHREAQARKTQQQNTLAAVRENNARLRQRLADLKNQAAVVINNTVRHVRLPKEYTTGKRAFYVILQYGRVYPCRTHDLSPNTDSIRWEFNVGRSAAYPIRDKGYLPGDRSSLQAIFTRLPRDLYLVFCVFEDSFGEYNQVKETASSSGLAFGWEPMRNQQAPVTFGPLGHTPKPQ